MPAKICKIPLMTALTAVTLASGMLSTATGKTYFAEDFRRYATVAPGTAKDNGITISNDPIWADRAEIQFSPVKKGFLFTNFKPDVATQALKAYDLNFTFRFMGKEKGSFDLVLRDAKDKDLAINFSRTEVTLSGQGVTAKGVLPVELPDSASCSVVIKVKNDTLEVFTDDLRVFKKILTAKIPVDGLKGFNFRGYETIGVRLTDIALQDPAPLKDFSAKKHFADFRSLRDDASFKTAQKLQEVTLTGAGDGVKFRVDAANPTLTFHWSDGQSKVYPITVGDMKVTRKVPGIELGVLTNSVIEVAGIAKQSVQPVLARFHSSYSHVPALVDILRDVAMLPKASEHPFDIDFQKRADGSVDIFFDGSFIKKMTSEGATLSKITLAFTAPTPVVVKQALKGVDAGRFMPLDLVANPRAKAFIDAKLSIPAGLQMMEGIPIVVADPVASADVGICRQGMGSWSLEVEEYLSRSPEDGFPSAIHYRVPPAVYTKAWVVCAIDPDKAKDPVLVARLGHYLKGGVGGNMLGDTTLVMPADGSIPKNMKEIGSVNHKGKAIPLYLLEMPLNMGPVLDFASRRPYLDFEFVGKQWINFEQLDRSMKPDPYSTSSFQIFGVTLEKAPVIMDMAQAQPGNVFTQGEAKPKTTVVLNSLQASKVKLAWRATDVDGAEVFKGAADAAFSKAGETKTIDIALTAKAIGFYDLVITLSDAAGKELVTHSARFAILPQNDRKATRYTSPYGTWWFGNSHGSVGDFDIAGPLLKKAGIHKCAWKADPDDSPDMIKYDLTSTGQLNFPARQGALDADGNFPEKVIVDAVDKINAHLAKFPKTDTILIWHESAPGYGIPEELLGLPVPEATERHIKSAAYVNAVGKVIREKFPKMKLQIGNSSASIGAATVPLRNGAKPEYYDSIGIESPAQVIVPEKLQEVGLQGLMISTDIASVLTKRPVPANGCLEYTYRCERDMGEQQQAEWYVRDILISLANNMTLIGPGIFIDCSTGYYNGLWGGSGIITRGPYVYPKRAYVAYAALTAVLDEVKFKKQLPTGSTTAYALAFDRSDKQSATALWTARGNADFTVTFDGNAKVRIFDMYGRETKQSGKSIVVKAGTSPAYLLTDIPVASVAIAARSFPKDETRAAKPTVAAALDTLEGLAVAPDADFTTDHTKFLPILKPSDFTVTAVTDEEKGACLEVTLDTTKNVDTSKYLTEFTTLTFAEAQAVPGNPAAIGVWVKGNSNWGQIRFTIEDAQGELFKSITTGGWGCDILDWPGNLSVNFDGWCYVAHPLRETKLFNDHSPGPIEEQWVSCGGDKVINLPVKIKAITVGMNRTKLDLLDFKASAPSLRLKNVGGIEE